MRHGAEEAPAAQAHGIPCHRDAGVVDLCHGIACEGIAQRHACVSAMLAEGFCGPHDRLQIALQVVLSPVNAVNHISVGRWMSDMVP